MPEQPLDLQNVAVTHGELAQTLNALIRVFWQPTPSGLVIQSKLGPLTVATIEMPALAASQMIKEYRDFLRSQQDLQRVAADALRTKR